MNLDKLKVAVVTAFENKEKRKTFVAKLVRAAFDREENGAIVVKHYNRSVVQEIEKFAYEIRAVLSDLGEDSALIVKWQPGMGNQPLRSEDAKDALENYFREKDPALADILQGATSEKLSRWECREKLTLYIKDDEKRERLLEKMPAITAALQEMNGGRIKVCVCALPLREAFCAAKERFREESPALYSLMEDVVSTWESYGSFFATPLFDETKAALLEHKAEIAAAMSEARRGNLALDIREAEYSDERIKAEAKKKNKVRWFPGGDHLTKSQRARVDERIEAEREKLRPRMPADERLRELAEQLRTLADQLLEAGASVECLENVPVLKADRLKESNNADWGSVDDCIHLHACRRLSKIARENGERFSRGCNRRCSAYEAE